MALFGKKNKKESVDKSNNSDDYLSGILSGDGTFDPKNMEEMGEFLNSSDIGEEVDGPNKNYDEYGDDDITDSGYVNPNKNDNSDEKDNSKKVLKYGIVGAVILVVIFSVALFSLSGGDGSGGNDGDNQETSQGDGSGVVVNEQINNAYKGDGDGNANSSGTGAILAFNYDYYVNRSGEEAIKHFNPDVNAYTASTIQAEIDKVAQGTTHELSITPRVLGEDYDVELILNIPGYDPVSYNQKFSIMERDGEYFIRSFSLSGESPSDEEDSEESDS